MRLRFAAALAVLVAACRDSTGPTVLSVNAVGSISSTVAGANVDSIRVRVTDASNNPQSSVSVTFAVTAGGGSVSPSVVKTDAQGLAATRFITGTTAGVNTVTATVTGATANVSVTTIAGPARTIAFRERIIFLDAGQSFTPSITASDANGNVVPVTQLTLQARSSSVVTVTANGSINAVSLAQTFVVASSSIAQDSVLVVVTSPNSPVLQSDLTRLDLPRDTTFTIPVVLDMRTAPEKLGATTVTIRWDPTQLTFVSHADGPAATGALVNATQVSQGVFTLALANAGGLAGRIELRRLTFRATAAPGKTGTLRLSASEVSAAGSFADLLPRTAAVTYPLSIR